MYLPRYLEQKDINELTKAITDYPFATLVTYELDSINADHIPLYWQQLSPQKSVLRGHIAKGNSLWKEISKGAEVLAIFHGPNSYVSPNYYPAKKEDGKVVPTWNYVVVHVRGNISFHNNDEWKLDMLNTLTYQHEEGQSMPWAVSDAPDHYIQKMLGGIVGIEVEINSMTGKWKVSQNQSEQNKQGVMTGLSELKDHKMAELINNYDLKS